MRRRTVCLLATVALASGPCLAFIDAKFTPKELVGQSRLILAGTLEASPDGKSWRLAAGECLKGGKAEDAPVGLAPSADQAEARTIREILSAGRGGPAVLFVAGEGAAALAYLHVGGNCLELRPAAGGWAATAVARKMSGVFAGGTDMLIRMAGYILSDGRADVPTSVGVSWMRDTAMLGKVAGPVTALHAVELGPGRRMGVFVAAGGGDRLFAAVKDDEAFEDITAAAGLEGRSGQSLWLDLDGRGQADLVSCDGRGVAVRRFRDGRFAAVGKAMPPASPCLGLAACLGPDGRTAVLASTGQTPLVLYRDRSGAWASAPLPGDDRAGEATCPCVVADFDSDGRLDVLQPRSKAGLLWKGKPGGFEAPALLPVSCGQGPGRLCAGDFDQDGSVDVFVSSPAKSELWENDGRGGFRAVIAAAGSLAYRCPPGASSCAAMDLNADGRTDLCLLYPKAEFAYHFNRGFRCFGEEGGLRLVAPVDAPAETGQVAAAAGDFNGDGSTDLAIAFASGHVVCHYNDAFSRPHLRVRLGEGLHGPVQFTVWQGEKSGSCLGTFLAAGPAVRAPLRDNRDCTIRYRLPGGKERSKTLHVPADPPSGGIEVTIEP